MRSKHGPMNSKIQPSSTHHLKKSISSIVTTKSIQYKTSNQLYAIYYRPVPIIQLFIQFLTQIYWDPVFHNCKQNLSQTAWCSWSLSRAVGHMTYGSAYREQIVDKLRKAAEHCDCLQCFFLIHSMGGGNGQNLSSNVFHSIDLYPLFCTEKHLHIYNHIIQTWWKVSWEEAKM